MIRDPYSRRNCDVNQDRSHIVTEAAQRNEAMALAANYWRDAVGHSVQVPVALNAPVVRAATTTAPPQQAAAPVCQHPADVAGTNTNTASVQATGAHRGARTPGRSPRTPSRTQRTPGASPSPNGTSPSQGTRRQTARAASAGATEDRSAASLAARRQRNQDTQMRPAMPGEQPGGDARRYVCNARTSRIQRRAMVGATAIPPDAQPGQWHAVGELTVYQCMVRVKKLIPDIPGHLVRLWQRAVVDVETYRLENADNVANQTLALKWRLVLGSLLLRDRAHMAERLHMWDRGDRRALVLWYLKDLRLLQARRYRQVSSQTAEMRAEAALEESLKLFADGQLQKATGLLTSHGLADAESIDVVAELERRHPERRTQMPTLGELGVAGDGELELDLREPLRRLKRRKGVGPGGVCNEHLRVLTWPSNDEKAARAVESLQTFGQDYVNGKLPAWFYYVFTAVRLVPLNKGPAAGDGVRPIAVGESERRLWWTAVASQFKESVMGIVCPEQVAVGVKAAGQKITTAMRLMLEANPTWVVIKLDIDNFFNEMDRATMMRRVAEHPELLELVPGLHAELSAASPVFLNAKMAEFDSQSGGQQGHPMVPIIAALYLNAHLKWATGQLNESGGAARGQTDDVYVCGPPGIAMQVAQGLKDRMEGPEDGLTLTARKSAVWSPSDESLEEVGRMLVGGERIPVGVALGGDGEVAGQGVMVSGVPIGDEGYVRTVLMSKTTGAAAKVNSVTAKLSSRHSQTAWTAVQYTLQPLLDFQAQCSYPSDMAHCITVFDAAVRRAAVQATGVPGMSEDPIARERVTLPARLKGCGLPDRARPWFRSAAWLGGINMSIPAFCASVGSGRVGFLQGAQAIVGAGTFEGDGSGGQYATLLNSQLRMAREIRNAWECCQDAVRDAGVELTGVLAGGPETAGWGVVDLQKEITVLVHDAIHQSLNRRIQALPVLHTVTLAGTGEQAAVVDERKRSWKSVDAFSRVWVTALPGRRETPGGTWVSNMELQYIVAMYLGVPVPVCEGRAGLCGAEAYAVGVLDRQGSALMRNTRIPGGHHTHYHDSTYMTVVRSLREYGVRVQAEPRDVFAAAAGHCRAHGLPGQWAEQQLTRAEHESTAGGRQLLIPDFVVTTAGGTPQFYEWKVATLCATNYSGGNRGGRWGAEGRAQREVADQARRLADLDALVVLGSMGAGARSQIAQLDFQNRPVSLAVRAVGGVLPLAVGAYAEGSGRVHSLCNAAVVAGAARNYIRMGCRSEAEARGVLATTVRRRWGMAFWRGAAALLHHRLPCLDSHATMPRSMESDPVSTAFERSDLMQPRDHARQQMSAAWDRGRGGY